jgi:DEAD/DEAH box helicase domain-containing protein
MFRALQVVRECECSQGCPSCIQLPFCRFGNVEIDKKGALTLLDNMVQQ